MHGEERKKVADIQSQVKKNLCYLIRLTQYYGADEEAECDYRKRGESL